MPLAEPYTVAIIDDEPNVLEALGSLLEVVGYSVRRFESAEDFLRADAVSAIGLPDYRHWLAGNDWNRAPERTVADAASIAGVTDYRSSPLR